MVEHTKAHTAGQVKFGGSKKTADSTICTRKKQNVVCVINLIISSYIKMKEK